MNHEAVDKGLVRAGGADGSEAGRAANNLLSRASVQAQVGPLRRGLLPCRRHSLPPSHALVSACHLLHADVATPSGGRNTTTLGALRASAARHALAALLCAGRPASPWAGARDALPTAEIYVWS